MYTTCEIRIPMLGVITLVCVKLLRNANEIERLGLHYGDQVFVEKGGEIIPKIVAVDVQKRDRRLLMTT